jgi:D-hydroxyproline dehydrogenase subunit alpha
VVMDAVASLGATDPRTVRSLTRAGMGWCQGRICAAACARLVAGLTGEPLTTEDLEAVGRRTLAAPLELSRLARLDEAGGPV